MDSRLFFNVTSWGYDILTDQTVWREQIAEVLHHIPDGTGISRVLDVGCGPGVSAFVLAAALPRAEVVGIDLSERMVARAQRHHQQRLSHLSNVSFEVGDATQLRFDSGSFDLVVGHSFLYLVPDRRAVLREVRRLLGIGGSVVLLEPNRRGSLRNAATARFDRDFGAIGGIDAALFGTSMVLWRLVSGNVGRLDPDDVATWMREAGFDEAQSVPTLGGLGMHCIGRVGNPRGAAEG